MNNRLTRRTIVGGALGAVLGTRIRLGSAQASSPAFAYPIGLPGRALGDGFVVRHGYATENTWYLPGYLHAGEDWYAVEGDTAGAGVYAVAAGEVVFAGSDYPGPVVIVQHAADLFSMYGHLEYELRVAVGEAVQPGQLLGTVLPRTDGRAPSHLHFEVRTFLTTPEVNGDAPRYGFGCGFQCPPGPSYWPLDAPDHPSDQGWRNPTHVLARRASGTERIAGLEVVVAAQPPSSEATVWSALPGEDGARQVGILVLHPGERLPLLAVRSGAEESRGTSAEDYDLWYRVETPEGAIGWVQAAVPSTRETGSDGRPSAVSFAFYPAVIIES